VPRKDRLHLNEPVALAFGQARTSGIRAKTQLMERLPLKMVSTEPAAAQPTQSECPSGEKCIGVTQLAISGRGDARITVIAPSSDELTMIHEACHVILYTEELPHIRFRQELQAMSRIPLPPPPDFSQLDESQCQRIESMAESYGCPH
jgi:hypothetical protein